MEDSDVARQKDEERAKKVIMAVDDMPSNLMKIKEILGNLYDVRLAKNAHMALSMLNRFDIDLILLDIEMPGMSGFEFMETCKEDYTRSKIPVIFVTSHATKDFVVRAAQAGARDYIAKPFDPETLRAKVNNVFHSGQGLAGLPFPDVLA
jgi:PleD family two-component response regulator